MAALMSKMESLPEYSSNDVCLLKHKLGEPCDSITCTNALIANSCFNYLNSSMPRRIMFYNKREWVDFSGLALQELIKGFKEGKSSLSFSMDDQPFLFDFLSMVLINLKTKKQQSVAWIDDLDKCFFPNFFFDEGMKESSSSVPGITGIKTHEIVKHVVEEAKGLGPKPISSQAEFLLSRVHKLKLDSENFNYAKKLFLSGMGPFATSRNVIHIHKCIQGDSIARAQLENFENQVNRTQAKRGHGNVRYGWFGSNKADILALAVNGFGKAGKPIEGANFGTGIYFTPESRAFASVNLCDIDENGMQFLMLCRIILGKPEKVKLGSKQCLPSSQDFDSGVDNLLSPNCYVVWPIRMNSSIHPEYVVSFNLSQRAREYLFGLEDVRFHTPMPLIAHEPSPLSGRSEPMIAPNSPWISLGKLFEELQDSICPLAKELCSHHAQEFRRNIITRAQLIRKIRLIIGDQLLFSVLQRCNRSQTSLRSTTLDDSKAKKMKFAAGSVSLRVDQNEPVIQNVEPNGSSLRGGYESAAPVIDLNVSPPESVELDNSSATPVKPTDSIIHKSPQ